MTNDEITNDTRSNWIGFSNLSPCKNDVPRNKREWTRLMLLDNGTLIAIVIALTGSVGMMIAFWNRTIQLEKEIRRLQIRLRSERTNK